MCLRSSVFPVDTHSQLSDSSSIPIIPWSFTKTTICPSFTPALSITQPADTYLRHSLFSSPSPNSFQARSALPPALLNILHSLLTVITVHSLFLNLHSSLQNQDLPPPPPPFGLLYFLSAQTSVCSFLFALFTW